MVLFGNSRLSFYILQIMSTTNARRFSFPSFFLHITLAVKGFCSNICVILKFHLYIWRGRRCKQRSHKNRRDMVNLHLIVLRTANESSSSSLFPPINLPGPFMHIFLSSYYPSPLYFCSTASVHHVWQR